VDNWGISCHFGLFFFLFILANVSHWAALAVAWLFQVWRITGNEGFEMVA
jgi:hypothetical protein